MFKTHKFKIDSKFSERFIETVIKNKQKNEGFNLTYAGSEGVDVADMKLITLEADEVALITREFVLLAADVKAQKLGQNPNFAMYRCEVLGDSNIKIKPIGEPNWDYILGLPMLYDTIINDLCGSDNILKFYERTLQQVKPDFSFTQETSVQKYTLQNDINLSI